MESINVAAALEKLNKISNERLVLNTHSAGQTENNMRLKVSDMRRILEAMRTPENTGKAGKNESEITGNPGKNEQLPLEKRIREWLLKNNNAYHSSGEWRNALVRFIVNLVEIEGKRQMWDHIKENLKDKI